MIEGKDLLIIGARAGGYGEGIAKAAVNAGARVFATTLNPGDTREQAFFSEIKAELIPVPLRYAADGRPTVFGDLKGIESRLRGRGVTRLDAIIHTVAGGFPRQPSVMKAVGDILKGSAVFEDLATAVKRNVYYVNGRSFEDTLVALEGLTDEKTHASALTYRGKLPYFISHSKKYLEETAARLARKNGRRTLVAALPEAWTQSSQFFTGIEIAVLQSYLQHLQGRGPASPDIEPARLRMEENLDRLEGLPSLIDNIRPFFDGDWRNIGPDSPLSELSETVHRLFARLRKDGSFPILRRSVEIISEFVREASGILVVREFLIHGRYEPGEVRQVRYEDLLGNTSIKTAEQRPKRPAGPPVRRTWQYFGKDEVRRVLNMYGPNFLFLDQVVMELGDLRDGMIGFGSFTVPTPEENPILKDHFVQMPLFGGHLQMEAVAQFGTFMLLKLLKDPRLVPILTGTEFPDLNTMAPPGETLSIRGTIRLREKRTLTLEAWIENRFARSRGIIRGMVLSERVVRKMVSSFITADVDED